MKDPENTSQRKEGNRPHGRILTWAGSIFGIIGIVVFGHGGCFYIRLDRILRQRIVVIPVDLSITGAEYEGRFFHTCPYAHGFSFKLDVSPPNSEMEKLMDAVKQVELEIRIYLSREILDFRIGPNDNPFFWSMGHDASARTWRLGGTHGEPAGEYRMHVKVLRGSPSLSGVKQTIWARYSFKAELGVAKLEVYSGIALLCVSAGLLGLRVVSGKLRRR